MWNRLLFGLLLLSGCASHKEDPLKNTKKLVKEGHSSLYKNGAFQIPATKIKLIPPGPDALELSKELAGLRAKESFLKYINEVSSSVVVIYEGTKKSYTMAKKVDKEIYDALSGLSPKLKKDSVIIMNSSLAQSKDIIGKSWKLSKDVSTELKSIQTEIEGSLLNIKMQQDDFKGWKNFVLGYVEFPSKLRERKEHISESLSLSQFSDNFKKANEKREKVSLKTTYLIGDSFKNYGKNISSSFKRAKGELNNGDEFGYSFAMLRSLRWVLDGIVWQGVVRPIGQLSAGAIGYVLVNGAAYPVYLVTRNGVTTAHIAVEVVRESAMGAVEVVAPTTQLALSSILYSGTYLANKTIEASAKMSGFILGKGIEYVAVPIASSGVIAVGTTSGVALGMGGGVLAGATRASGELLGVSSNVISKSAAAATLAAGTAVYTSKGTGEVAYEVTKATVVPPSLVLGSGLTLTYGTLSQLTAQTVLSASDAAYLVLSMEGPNWVIYAVQGKLGKEDVRGGAVLDLEKMRSEGEEIRKVPASEEEIKKVLEGLGSELT